SPRCPSGAGRCAPGTTGRTLPRERGTKRRTPSTWPRFATFGRPPCPGPGAGLDGTSTPEPGREIKSGPSGSGLEKQRGVGRRRGQRFEGHESPELSVRAVAAPDVVRRRNRAELDGLPAARRARDQLQRRATARRRDRDHHVRAVSAGFESGCAEVRGG